MTRSSVAAALPFLLLFAALYAGFGVQSPFLPALLAGKHLSSAEIGLVMGAGTAVRLAAGPLAGRLADRFAATRLVFAVCAATAAIVVFGYWPVQSLWPVLAVSLMQSIALAPLAPLGDTLVLAAAAPKTEAASGFDYGWARGTGSAAFIAGLVASGQLVAGFGFAVIAWLHAALVGAAGLLALRTPKLGPTRRAEEQAAAPDGFASLLRVPEFRRVIAVAALVLGSHALHDNFAVIRWGEAGIGSGAAGILWSEAVAAEVIVFLLIGRPLLNRVGPPGAAVIAAVAGIVRWSVAAQTAWLPAIALIQPLHGLTFGLLHLACMQRLAEYIPPHLSATALTFYGTVGIGAATALLTLASGSLYGAIGPAAFWIMAALCALALPFARRL